MLNGARTTGTPIKRCGSATTARTPRSGASTNANGEGRILVEKPLLPDSGTNEISQHDRQGQGRTPPPIKRNGETPFGRGLQRIGRQFESTAANGGQRRSS